MIKTNRKREDNLFFICERYHSDWPAEKGNVMKVLFGSMNAVFLARNVSLKKTKKRLNIMDCASWFPKDVKARYGLRANFWQHKEK